MVRFGLCDVKSARKNFKSISTIIPTSLGTSLPYTKNILLM